MTDKLQNETYFKNANIDTNDKIIKSKVIYDAKLVIISKRNYSPSSPLSPKSLHNPDEFNIVNQQDHSNSIEIQNKNDSIKINESDYIQIQNKCYGIN